MAASIYGYTPFDLRNAYGLGQAAVPKGMLNGNAKGLWKQQPAVAIVSAYDDANAESDLGIYRNRFGLPPCTTSNGCFTKVAQNSAPPAPAGWMEETSLDLAMVSAACPNCRIVLVEAPSDDTDLIGGAVDYAASLNPAALSVSFGVDEQLFLSTGHAFGGTGDHYTHPGIPIVASAGDDGTPQFPASSPNVIAVAGTSLHRDSSARGFNEQLWAPSSVGCSIGEAAPSWQSTSCSTRSVADVGFDADPTTGVAVYDSNDGGWIVMGGTSVGAPFVAGLFGAANDYPSGALGAAPLYSRASALYPLSSGALGTPNGLGAF
ncbi:MAG: peptidase S8 [Candidatus Eremiobacteraeota bacterium]|nr:peptidase S8 [Candidatus Eremiobacteraeota bacterium]